MANDTRHADWTLYQGDLAIAYLADALWACYAASGADTDGANGPGAIIAGMGLRGYAEVVIEAVKELRSDYEEALSLENGEEDFKVGGKPFHGWSCNCAQCLSYSQRREPRPGEIGA